MTVILKMTVLRLALSLLGLLAPVAAFADPAVTTYQYDPNGNLTQIADPLNHVTQHDYDRLDQVVQTRQPHPDLPGQTLGQIDAEYDGLGQLTQVIDPRNLSTDYQVDSLGNFLMLTSPDTGVTTFTYDEAGNVKTQTDARGETATSTYDSQNRITQIGYDDQTVTYTWDSCAYGIGRLCSLNNGSSQLAFSYDLHGRITQQNQSVGTVTLTVGYHYNPDGQLDQLTTPGGQLLAYAWQSGRIASITVNGQPLIGQIAYEPDGQVGSWVWGNNEPTQRLYDLAGRPVLIDFGLDASSQLLETLNYGYDAASRLTDLQHTVNASADQHHDYDGLDRLTASTQGVPIQNSDSYDYDLSGNRTTQVHNTNATTSSVDPGSNRLQGLSGSTSKSYSYDAVGHLTGDGTLTYTYNAAGRRISATGPTLNASYAYNGRGQRVKKTVNGVTTLFAYDKQGHLLGEYDGNGQPLQEIVWLGDLPIAVLKPVVQPGTGIDVFYLHADHLGTPRKISRPSDNQVMWTWESEAFGNTLPNQNPTGQGDFVFNLRFQGQYADAETGLNYNYFRDYDPAIGRYIQSDPIGLAGGINTYGYVGGNPVYFTDPLGLVGADPLLLDRLGGSTAGGGANLFGGTKAICPPPNSINAQSALRSKLSGLQKAQQNAANTRELPDGRIRYYTKEVPARNEGVTRGASFVTEYNPVTGQVKQWMENYNQSGQINRVHPKSIDGQTLNSQHYPPTAKELGE
jgi:RHS repeat-associated protein